MYYRIVAAPPGYGPDQRFMVVSYLSIDPRSSKHIILSPTGDRFVATMEEAHSLIPKTAELLSLEQDAQFLELWGDKPETDSSAHGNSEDSL